METLLFIIEAFVIVVVVFFSVKNDRLREGDLQVGPFRYRDSEPAVPVNSLVAPGSRAGQGRDL